MQVMKKTEKTETLLPYPVVLASASPRRREILEQIGIEPVVVPGSLEEKTASTAPEEVVKELSLMKAQHVYETSVKGRMDGAVVIGSDTVVSAGGRILGKPATKEEAKDMIRLLSGGVHEVYTGVTLIRGERKITFAEKTAVSVWPMTEEEIEAYAACGESMDKAGAYGIQGRFAAFIRGIDGSYTNVMGLPAGRTYQELKRISEEKND